MKSQISNLKSQISKRIWKLEIVPPQRDPASGGRNWKFPPAPRAGFTLIEILVVVTVVLILLTISFGAYSNLSNRQALLSAGLSMKNIARDAQNRAYTGVLDCNVCDCSIAGMNTLKGWYVDFTTREIYGECQTPAAGPTITIMPKAFGLPIQVTTAPHITPPTKILFYSYPPSVDRPGTICLSSQGVTGYYVVRINTAGQISDVTQLVSTCP